MKPKLRYEASIDFHAGIVGAAFRAIETTLNYPFQSCINCAHFVENTMFCLKWDARPPAKVIVYGCEAHSDIGEVPF